MAKAHDMFLEGAMENGVGEWHCPACGRRLLVRLQPTFAKIVLNSGDELVNHVSVMGNATVINTAETNEDLTDMEWLENNGISWE